MSVQGLNHPSGVVDRISLENKLKQAIIRPLVHFFEQTDSVQVWTSWGFPVTATASKTFSCRSDMSV